MREITSITIQSESIENRIKIVNEIISLIAITGRKFFYLNGKISYFILDKKLWFMDSYTGKRIYPYSCRAAREMFICGGGLWALINQFRHYIMTGTHYMDGGGLYDDKYWGYPEEDMNIIRRKAKELGYLGPDD